MHLLLKKITQLILPLLFMWCFYSMATFKTKIQSQKILKSTQVKKKIFLTVVEKCENLLLVI